MNVRAAVLVDAENVSGKQHMVDVHHFLQTTCAWYQAQVEEFAVHGDIQTHMWWRHPQYHISYYQHAGGKNAADKQIRQHAFTLAEQGVALFYLVSNDKHLAVVAEMLEMMGCSVFCLGTRLAAYRLRSRADFCRLDQRIVLVSGAATFRDLPLQGETMTKSYYQSSSPSDFEQLTSPERVEQALQIVYQHGVLPDLYPRFLGRFLQWVTQALGMADQGGSWIAGNPGEIATMLKEMEQDPLLSICVTAEGRAQWDGIYAFANRCTYAYTCGWEAGSRLVERTPHLAMPELLQVSAEKKAYDWEQQLFPDLPDEQQPFFRHVDMSERLIWHRWYGRGREQGAQEKKALCQKAWIVNPSALTKEANAGLDEDSLRL